MKEKFIELCELWSFISFCEWSGDYPKAFDACRRLDEAKKGYPILNFFAQHFHSFFVFK